MFRQFLNSADLKLTILIFLLEIPIIMLSLSLHETAHGYVAYRRGDGTARAFGRLTLNPIKHFDLIGAIFMFLFGFGWAKPVPVTVRNLRNPRRDMALIAFAGPATNLMLAFVFTAAYMLLWRFFPQEAFDGITFTKGSAIGTVTIMCYLGIILNVGLAMFNLIPLPPLDGANILLFILPKHLAARYAGIGRYIRYIYLAVVALSWFAPRVFNLLFAPLDWISENLALLFCLPYKLMFIGGNEILYEYAIGFIK